MNIPCNRTRGEPLPCSETRNLTPLAVTSRFSGPDIASDASPVVALCQRARTARQRRSMGELDLSLAGLPGALMSRERMASGRVTRWASRTTALGSTVGWPGGVVCISGTRCRSPKGSILERARGRRRQWLSVLWPPCCDDAASIAQMGCGEWYGPLPATGESVSFTSPALSCSEPMPQPTNRCRSRPQRRGALR